MIVCLVASNELCAWPWWYANFASQQCEPRGVYDWNQINRPDRHMMWWEAGYREWIGEDDDMDNALPHLGIHKAICAIRLAIASGGGVQKTIKAPMGYMFRGIEAFDNILCGLTAEHNIAGPYPRILSKEIVHGLTSSGKYQSHVIVEIEWTYVCSLDGSSQVTSTVGEAMDTQDKAFNKAMQASRKYADIMVFRIPTAGDDTEIYVPEPSARTDRPHGVDTPIAAQVAHTNGTAAPQEQAKRTRGPNKPKEAPAEASAEVTNPGAVLGEAPFPDGGGGNVLDVNELLERITTVNTFPVLYAMAQDAETSVPVEGPNKQYVFAAIKKRAMFLFGEAKDMKGVQEGFELVTALGQPADLRTAANQAFAKFRSGPNAR